MIHPIAAQRMFHLILNAANIYKA